MVVVRGAGAADAMGAFVVDDRKNAVRIAERIGVRQDERSSADACQKQERRCSKAMPTVPEGQHLNSQASDTSARQSSHISCRRALPSTHPVTSFISEVRSADEMSRW
jgi:Zn-dependent protease with chaperone function